MENTDSFFMIPIAAMLNMLGMAAIGFDAWFAGWIAISVGFGIFLTCFVGVWVGTNIELADESVWGQKDDQPWEGTKIATSESPRIQR